MRTTLWPATVRTTLWPRLDQRVIELVEEHAATIGGVAGGAPTGGVASRSLDDVVRFANRVSISRASCTSAARYRRIAIASRVACP